MLITERMNKIHILKCQSIWRNLNHKTNRSKSAVDDDDLIYSFFFQVSFRIGFLFLVLTKN